MLKGSQRQMIVVQTTKSRYFDGAYFILRREVGTVGEEETDILREANRIFEDSAPGQSEKKRRFSTFFAFLAGCALGGTVIFLLCLLV